MKKLWSLPGRIKRRLWQPRKLRFTKEGRYFVAITVGIGLAAINTGNNLLYLLLGWLLSSIVASGMLSDMTMRGLRVVRRAPGTIFANRPFLMEVSVENKKPRLASYSIEIEDLVDGRPLDKKCYFLKIPQGRTQRTSYRHTFPRRGVYTLDGVRISTKFPFALFRKSRDVEEIDEVLVFPEVYPVPPPAPRARYLGETQVQKIGRRGEFFGLREYRDGDDRRSIHWRSSARTGRLLVREFEEEAQQRATILIDNALPADHDDDASEALERAISFAASLTNTYVNMGYAVRFIARGVHIPFSAGPSQLTRVLRELALLETVTEDVRFSAPVDPRSENILVLPSGVPGLENRPAGISHVLEAG